ncbi:MAG: hypothetical protein ACPK85_08175 [Methanosarcina sp.]
MVSIVKKQFFCKHGRSFPADYTYWKEKGWLARKVKYYVDMPVNPFYNAIGWVSE